MIDPEDPAAKNEQELNLFSDQPQPGEPSAGSESAADVPGEASSGEPPAQETSADTAPAEPPAQETPVEPAPAAAAAPATQADAPVIAPPPPRRQPASLRPGIVAPRPGRASFPPSAPAADTRARKPLPQPLQPGQSLGQMLTAIRNARGMSLEEVALGTRIRMEYLVELEADDLLKRLPPVYISAYVRKLIEVYDLSDADSGILMDKMHGETPPDKEELPEKLIESVNEGALVNEGENKRIRNITFIFFGVIGLVAAALIWLIILVVVNHARTSKPVPGNEPGSVVSGAVQQAEEPVFQTVHMEESELDALIVPETPSISVLKMSKSPGVRESL